MARTQNSKANAFENRRTTDKSVPEAQLGLVNKAHSFGKDREVTKTQLLQEPPKFSATIDQEVDSLLEEPELSHNQHHTRAASQTINGRTAGDFASLKAALNIFENDSQDKKCLDPLYAREDLFHTNQRILEIGDSNKYHVTRSDF